jgi:hypothetical protein
MLYSNSASIYLLIQTTESWMLDGARVNNHKTCAVQCGLARPHKPRIVHAISPGLAMPRYRRHPKRGLTFRGSASGGLISESSDALGRLSL